MDIGVARTFLEVIKTGSFVSAAANLGITQTAVSARIRVLEDQLGRPMFVRNKAGARLTPAGEQFLPFASDLVHVWERARHAVALPPERATLVAIGAEHSIWSPVLRHWLLWMRRECPEFAVSTRIDSAHCLMEQVQEGALDIAILYAAPHKAGVVAELLFEEKLVLVRTAPADRRLGPEDHVRIDWGPEFAAGYQAAFPNQPSPLVSISYGPLALDYMLAVGGTGYFREGFVRPLLEQGRLALVPDSPAFSYSAYAVHSASADETLVARIRTGLRASAAIAVY